MREILRREPFAIQPTYLYAWCALSEERREEETLYRGYQTGKEDCPCLDVLCRPNQLRGTVFCPRTQTVNMDRAREIRERKAEQDEAEENLRKKVYGEKWQQVKW